MKKYLRNIVAIIGIGVFGPLSAQVTYKIGPSSTIQILGTSTVSDWVVTSPEVSGEMLIIASTAKGKESDVYAGTIKDARAVLQVSSIKSEKGETMDNKMYNALKYDTHPEIVFVLTKPIQLEKAGSKFTATGNIQLAGVTRPMTFNLTAAFADNSFHFVGSGTLKLSDFQIDPPTAMFGQIQTGDEVEVKLNLVFSK
jgi:polyisoprenoid-binding protein YceI